MGCGGGDTALARLLQVDAATSLLSLALSLVLRALCVCIIHLYIYKHTTHSVYILPSLFSRSLAPAAALAHYSLSVARGRESSVSDTFQRLPLYAS